VMREEMVEQIERNAFDYFVKQANPRNGLVADTTRPGSPASIAVAGFALTAYTVGVERGFIPRSEAIERTLAMVRFFASSPQGTDPDDAGHKGFYYHFLNLESGLRMWKSELSLIDSTFLLAGMLSAAAYFNRDTAEELEIRTRVDQIYRRADWRWAQNGKGPVSHGWKPECGFLHYGWDGYNEAVLLYVLGLGSPTHPLPESSYQSWTLGYQWENLYDVDVLHAGPLFMNQFSHAWIDFRGIQDAFMREKKIDYFENTRRATYLQQAYARRNPRCWKGYGPDCWGISACDGPGFATRRIDGTLRQFLGYASRSIPCGPDDGTLAPGAVVASLPFAPEIVFPALAHLTSEYPGLFGENGVKGGFNPSFAVDLNGPLGWVSDDYFGLDQGMTVLMVENYRSGFVWKLMKQCRVLVDGLRRAGFSGGWL
jgi:hypothetical protein